MRVPATSERRPRRLRYLRRKSRRLLRGGSAFTTKPSRNMPTQRSGGTCNASAVSTKRKKPRKSTLLEKSTPFPQRASRAAGSVVMAGAADEVTPCASRTAWSVGKERATTHPGLSCTTTRVRTAGKACARRAFSAPQGASGDDDGNVRKTLSAEQHLFGGASRAPGRDTSAGHGQPRLRPPICGKRTSCTSRTPAPSESPHKGASSGRP